MSSFEIEGQTCEDFNLKPETEQMKEIRYHFEKGVYNFATGALSLWLMIET